MNDERLHLLVNNLKDSNDTEMQNTGGYIISEVQNLSKV